MSIIRLTKTAEFERILDEIRLFYPLLDDTEIIKMAVSSYYTNLKHLPSRPATSQEEAVMAEARKDFEGGHYKMVRSHEVIDLDTLLNE